ncbi:LOW QUALITY PROTEIN: hypothetical protein TorRG33x02_060280 [Trema orientale]|uniref:DUF8040 domain-containing protein n=1 Tax=Trema orientale TaxID=63057 RepID=A0A2P5FK75_TREOI|nr:LOW QUALITY PROTEIN: hypothetical protein TorRG33x02_060280 [Trema orientale]
MKYQNFYVFKFYHFAKFNPIYIYSLFCLSNFKYICNICRTRTNQMDDSSSSSSSSDFDDFVDFMMLILLGEYDEIFIEKVPQRTSILSGEAFVRELLDGHERTCYELLRMDRNIFLELCASLKQNGYLKDTREIKVEEAVAIFLIIVGQNMGMRLVADRFQHSLETIDRHFHLTLKAICRLGKNIIRPTQAPLPSHVVNSSKYYPWFQVIYYIKDSSVKIISLFLEYDFY